MIYADYAEPQDAPPSELAQALQSGARKLP